MFRFPLTEQEELNKHKLKSYEDAIRQYPFIRISLTFFQTLLASYFLTAAVLPEIDQQGTERRKYMYAGIISMTTAQFFNFIVETGLLTALINKLSKKENSSQKSVRALRHLRTAALEIGVLFEFLRSTDADWFAKGFNIGKWLNHQTTSVRSAIILPSVVLKALVSYQLNTAEQSLNEISDDRKLLANERGLNTATRIRWLLNLPWTYINGDITARLLTAVIEDFGVELSRDFNKFFPIAMGVTATLFNFMPDHPKFTQAFAQKLKWVSRFGDSFFKFAPRNIILSFMFTLNAISLIEGKLQINLDTSTALVLLLSSVPYSLLAGEFLLRIKSTANDNPITVSALLKTGDFIDETTKAMVWWIKIFGGNPYAAIYAGLQAGAALMIKLYDVEKAQYAIQRFFLQFMKNFNDVLFETSLALSLTKLDGMKTTITAGTRVPIAFVAATLSTVGPDILKRFPGTTKLGSYILGAIKPAIECTLIFDGLFHASKQLLVEPYHNKPLSAQASNAIEYTMVALVFLGTVIWKYHQTKKQNEYEAINANEYEGINAEDKPSENTYKKLFKNMAERSATIVIGTATLKHFAEKALDSGPSSKTGNPEILALMFINILLVIYLLYQVFSRINSKDIALYEQQQTFSGKIGRKKDNTSGNEKSSGLSRLVAKFSSCLGLNDEVKYYPGSPGLSRAVSGSLSGSLSRSYQNPDDADDGIQPADLLTLNR